MAEREWLGGAKMNNFKVIKESLEYKFFAPFLHDEFVEELVLKDNQLIFKIKQINSFFHKEYKECLIVFNDFECASFLIIKRETCSYEYYDLGEFLEFFNAKGKKMQMYDFYMSCEKMLIYASFFGEEYVEVQICIEAKNVEYVLKPCF